MRFLADFSWPLKVQSTFGPNVTRSAFEVVEEVTETERLNSTYRPQVQGQMSLSCIGALASVSLTLCVGLCALSFSFLRVLLCYM